MNPSSDIVTLKNTFPAVGFLSSLRTISVTSGSQVAQGLCWPPSITWDLFGRLVAQLPWWGTPCASLMQVDSAVEHRDLCASGSKAFGSPRGLTGE